MTVQSKFFSEDLEAQMFSVMDSIRGSFDQARTTMSSVETTSREVRDDISAMRAQIQSILGTAQSFFGITEVVLQICKIASFIFLLTEKANRNLASISALIALIIPAGAGNLGQSFVLSLTRATFGVMRKYYIDVVTPAKHEYNTWRAQLYEHQNGRIFRYEEPSIELEDLEAQADGDDSSIIVALFSLVKECTVGLFKGISPSQVKSMQISSQKVKILSETLKACRSFAEFMLTAVQKILAIVSDKLLRCYGILPEFLRDDSVAEMIDEYILYKVDGYFEKACTDIHYAMLVKSLRNRFMMLEATLNKRLSRKLVKRCFVLPYIATISRSLDTVWTTIPLHLREGTSRGRKRPFCLWLHGLPGLGKSSTIQHYIINRIAMKCRLITSYQNPDNYSYFRDLGAEYWEKYHNQIVVQYNDIFQTYTDENMINEGIREFTNINDDAIYPLNTAFGDKGSVYFTSPIVIVNAQSDIIGAPWLSAKCLSNGAHFYRRRHVVVELMLNEKYLNSTGVGADVEKFKTAMQMFPLNCIGSPQHPLFPADAYAFRFTNPLTGEMIFTLNFPEGIKYIEDQAALVLNSGDSLKDRLYSTMEYEWENDAYGGLTVPVDVSQIRVSTNAFDQQRSYSRGHRRYDQDECIYAQMFRSTTQDDMHSVNSDPEQPMCTCLYKIQQFRSIMMVPEDDITFLQSCYSKPHEVCISGAADLYDKFIKKPDMNSDVQGAIDDLVAGVRQAVNAERDRQEALSSTAIAALQLVSFTALLGGAIGAVYYFKQKYQKQAETQDPIEAQTHEGDRKNIKQIRKKNKLPEHIIAHENSEPLEAHIMNQSNSDIENILTQQMVVLQLRAYHEGKSYSLESSGNAIGVGADLFMMPHHYYRSFLEFRKLLVPKGDEVYLHFSWRNRDSTNVNWNNLSFYDPPGARLADVVFMRIKNINHLRNISHHFCEDSNSVDLNGSYLYGVRLNNWKPSDPNFIASSYPVSNVRTVNATYYVCEKLEHIYGSKIAKTSYTVENMLCYSNAMAQTGDCGMLLMHTDSRNNRKILGMHTAGGTITGTGYAVRIYASDIEDAHAHFNKDPSYVYMAEEKMMNVEKSTSKLLDSLQAQGFIVVGKPKPTEYHGVVKKVKLNIPRKTKIVQTPYFDLFEEDFGPHSTVPAVLAPYTLDGQRFSPFLTSCAKLRAYSPMIQQEQYDLITQHICETIKSWDSKYSREPRLLTDFEIINGKEGLNSIDMDTSAGYPFVTFDNSNGKKPFFTRHDGDSVYYTANEEVVKLFTQYEKDCIAGIAPETYWIDTLKDELRPIEKCTKPRIFECGALIHTMLMRKYFGDFVAHCQSTYLQGEMAIGVNPTSTEWTQKTRLFLSVSNMFLNGDYKWYDSSLAYQICMVAAYAANFFYDDGPENARIRFALLSAACSSRHIIEDIIIWILQGNPSGFWLTTVINIIVNMFFIRYAYSQLVDYDLVHFTKFILAWFYGDDNMVAIHSRISHLINMFTYTDCMRTIGITYTGADKKVATQELIPLEECSFLKRSFVFDPETKLYLSPLDLKVIYEIPRYAHNGVNIDSEQISRFNASLWEISQYGQLKFVEIKKFFVKYCVEANAQGHVMPCDQLFSFNQCRSLMYPTFYPSYSKIPKEIHREDIHDFTSELIEAQDPKKTFDIIKDVCATLDAILDPDSEQSEDDFEEEEESDTDSQPMTPPMSFHVFFENLGAVVFHSQETYLRYTYLDGTYPGPFPYYSHGAVQDLCVLSGPAHWLKLYALRDVAAIRFPNLTPEQRVLRFGQILDTSEWWIIECEPEKPCREHNWRLPINMNYTDRERIVFYWSALGYDSREVFGDNPVSLNTFPPGMFDDDEEEEEFIPFPPGMFDHDEEEEEIIAHSGHITLPLDDALYEELEDRCITAIRRAIAALEPSIRAIKNEVQALVCNESMIVREIMRVLLRFMVPQSMVRRVLGAIQRDDTPPMDNFLLEDQPNDLVLRRMDDLSFDPINTMSPVSTYSNCPCHIPFHLCDESCFDFCDAVKKTHVRFPVRCELCKVPINNELMYEQHIVGRNHLKKKNSHPNYVARPYKELLEEMRVKHFPTSTLVHIRESDQYRFQQTQVLEEEIVAQMMSGDTTISQQKITTFVDAGETHDENGRMWHGSPYTDVPFLDLNSMLKRPFLLKQYLWPASVPFSTAIFTLNFPSSFTTASNLANRLQNMAFWSPNFELTVRINGTPMHYGRMAFVALPYTPNAPPFPCIFSSESWYQVSANAQQQVVVDIPYLAIEDRLQISQQTGVTNPLVNNDFMSLHAYVSIPLQSVNGAAASIEVSIYGRIVDHNCCAFNPIPFDTIIAQMFDGIIDDTPQFGGSPWPSDTASISPQIETDPSNATDEIHTNAQPKNVVSTIVRKIGGFAATFRRVPLIGAFADPISYALTGAAELLKYYGYSIPPSIAPANFVTLRSVYLTRQSDATMSMVTDTIADATVVKDISLVYGKPSDMSIAAFCMRPGLIAFNSITSAQVVGTRLFHIGVSPWDCEFVSPTGSFRVAPTPCAFMSRFFHMWRGSMRYHFAFCASSFHSVRVRITYSPFLSLYSMKQADNAVSVILDITGEVEYSLLVPYMQTTDWRLTQGGLDTPTALGCNGSLSIFLVNVLTSGATTVNPIHYQIFASAGPDIQFAIPHVPIIEERYLTAQMMGKLDACALPSSSYFCLSKVKYNSIGVTGAHLSQRIQTSNEITGIRQLCNLLTPVVAVGTEAGVPQVFTIDTGAIFNPNNNIEYNTYFAHFSQVFRYFRGSFRVSVTSPHSNTITTVVASPFSANTRLVTQGFGGSALNTLPNSNMRYSFAHQVQNNMSQQGDFTIPTYSLYKRHLTYHYFAPTQQQIMRCTITSVNPTVATIYTLSLGVGDDFMFGFPCCIPMMSLGATTRRRRAVDTQNLNLAPPLCATIPIEDVGKAVLDNKPLYRMYEEDEDDETPENLELPIPTTSASSLAPPIRTLKPMIQFKYIPPGFTYDIMKWMYDIPPGPAKSSHPKVLEYLAAIAKIPGAFSEIDLAERLPSGFNPTPALRPKQESLDEKP